MCVLWMKNHALGLLVALVAAVDVPSCLAFFVSAPPQLLRMSSLAAAPDGGDTAEGSKAPLSQRTIVVVGLNGALQRTIVFKPPKGLHVGHVNRASSVGQGIGGKGQNVCVALRKLSDGGGCGGDGGEVDVTLAHFAGGKSGVSRCANRAWIQQCPLVEHDQRFGE